MANDVAIRVEGLGKCYRLGERSAPYRTLRETVMGLGAAFRRGAARKDTIWALKDVDLEVRRGDVLGVIGRNGAGKTTLLKILSRITEPTTGRVELHGRVGSLLEVGTGFHPELTGRENIYLNGAILGMRKAEIARKFDEIVVFAEVERFLDTPVKHYSSGMYVRLAFAVAAHMEPEILLIDEVLAVGDLAFQRKCLGRMREVARGGRTVIFVSHNLDSIVNLCEWAAILLGGRLSFFGESGAAVRRYVAGFPASGEGWCDLAVHPGRAPGMQTMATGIGVRDAHEPGFTGTIATGSDMILEFDYDCDAEVIDSIQLGISTLLGQRLMTVGTHLTPGFHETLRGRGKLECRLRDLRLAPGDYSVTIMLGRGIPRMNLDVVTDAIKFSVVAGDYWGSGRAPLPAQGPLAQKSEWTVVLPSGRSSQ